MFHCILYSQNDQRAILISQKSICKHVISFLSFSGWYVTWTTTPAHDRIHFSYYFNIFWQCSPLRNLSFQSHSTQHSLGQPTVYNVTARQARWILCLQHRCTHYFLLQLSLINCNLIPLYTISLRQNETFPQHMTEECRGTPVSKTTARINVQHLECMAFQNFFKGRYVYYSEAWALNLLSRMSAHMPVWNTFPPMLTWF